MQRAVIEALTLTTLLAAGGCTTNKVPGNGQPSSSPEVGSAGTAATPGSSSGTSGTPTTPANPPIVSSSEDAAATIGAPQPHTGRILGPADPGGSSQPATAATTTPRAESSPQLTVNS